MSGPGFGGRQAWIDASAGIAGDMLLGALIDAGAELVAVQEAVDAVLRYAARLVGRQVRRAGLRAQKIDVQVLVADQPHRPFRRIKELLDAADIAPRIRERATAVFARLAEAEALVHGVGIDEVHFHEVGAIDSIADIVGVCAALEYLGIDVLTGGPVALGSGRMAVAHGDMPVPGPAVTQLALGWAVTAGGEQELTTPTGMALLTALCSTCQELPAMQLDAVGMGAGSRDDPRRANITRVLIGFAGAPADAGEVADLLETNVDDLDPRVWPNVLEELMRAGAADAWLTPISMKKGRPAHTLSVLTDPNRTAALRQKMMDHTSTFGVRQSVSRKFALERGWIGVSVAGQQVSIKVAHRNAMITRATPEYADVEAVAMSLGQPVLAVLEQARGAAAAIGLLPGSALPGGLRPFHHPAAIHQED